LSWHVVVEYGGVEPPTSAMRPHCASLGMLDLQNLSSCYNIRMAEKKTIKLVYVKKANPKVIKKLADNMRPALLSLAKK